MSFIYVLQLIMSFFKVKKDVRNHDNNDFIRYVNSDNMLPISVLIPAYNEQENIVQNIKSLSKIKYPQFEIIVINDGSKDNTH